MKRPLVLLVVGVVVVAGLAVSAVLALAQQPVILRLGLLSAADSSAGRGVQLAIAEINGAGGIVGPDDRLYAFELLSVPVRTADEVRAGLDALAERDVVAILGPDETAVTRAVFRELQELKLPVLTAATGDSITIVDMTDYIFRARAPEQVYVQAVVDYLREQDASPSIVVVRSGDQVAESVESFTALLGSRNIVPRSTLQLNGTTNLQDVLANLQNLNPDVVAVWSDAQAAADLLVGLRERGWDGTYFYRNASDPAFRAIVQDKLGAQPGMVLGVDNWVPGVRSEVSDRFLQRFVVTFASVPDGYSAAYYDAIYLLARAIQRVGGAPDAIQRGLQQLTSQMGVQGTLNPARYSVGETINAAVLFELNSYAAPQVRSLYVNSVLVANPGEDVPPLGTPVPPTPAATATPVPTATPEGVWGTVDSARLNVRTGPGLTYDVLGQLEAGDVVQPIGANADFTWLVVPFRGTTGWVAAYLVDLSGNLNSLPFIQPPPSPTPVITPTATPAPIADLIIVSAAVEPLRPLSGQQFLVRVMVRNQGNTISGETAVAASFQPGSIYRSAPIPALVPGQAVEVILNPAVTGSGTFTVELVADLNNLVNEGPAGEANNLYPVTYTLDHAMLKAGAVALAPGQLHDVMGSGLSILAWDGGTLSAVNGAQLAVLPNLNWNTLHYDQLSGVGGYSVPRASLPNGVIVGFVTAPEGYRGALRIDGYDGNTLRYTYRVYAP